jgi:hypothetical protein
MESSLYAEYEALRDRVRAYLDRTPAARSIIVQKHILKQAERDEQRVPGLLWHTDVFVALYPDYCAQCEATCNPSMFSIVLSALCYQDGDLSLLLQPPPWAS